MEGSEKNYEYSLKKVKKCLKTVMIGSLLRERTYEYYRSSSTDERKGKKVCRSSECDGYCYFIAGYEDNEHEERREIIYQYCAYHDFEKNTLSTKID